MKRVMWYFEEDGVVLLTNIIQKCAYLFIFHFHHFLNVLFLYQLLRALKQLELDGVTLYNYSKPMDVWSYGGFLYWLLTGENLFQNEAEAKSVLLDRDEYGFISLFMHLCIQCCSIIDILIPCAGMQRLILYWNFRINSPLFKM